MINQQIKHKLLFSVFGFGFPLLIAVFSIPWLLHHMGLENFAVLTLAWVVVGFAGILDLGLGRTFTREVAQRSSNGQDSVLWRIFLFILTVLVVVASLVYILASLSIPWLVEWLTWQASTDTSVQVTTIATLLYAVPFVIVSATFVGLLEGIGAIKKLNAIRLLTNSLIFIAPIIAWQFTQSLIQVMLSLVVVRFFSFLLYFLACMPRLIYWFRIRSYRTLLNYRELLIAGGWMSVSTILAPVLTTFDRFLIGSVVSVSVVAYYSTPIDMLMKLQVFSVALMSVLFPAFAASVLVDIDRVRSLFLKGSLLLFVVMFSIAVPVTWFSEFLLGLWLGEEFAQQSSSILRWAAIGLVVNAMSFVPFGLLQAIGRADLTGKLNLIELPFYLIMLYFSLLEFGIVGAAVVSTVRLTFNAVILFVLTSKLVPELKRDVFNLLLLMFFSVSLLLTLGAA